MELQYLLLDVFTTERLKGNQLAVVCNGDGLLDNEMLAIASEFNLSETVFLTKAAGDRNTSCVRIFTPKVELPFAGHPTLGASIVLGLERDVPVVRLEERVGVITALVERTGKHSGKARFTLPRLPDEAGNAPDTGAVAMALGILPEDIGCGLYKPAVMTAGNLFYLIPVRNAKVLANLKLERRGWSEVFPLERHAVYVFTETPEEDGIDFAARMFAPGMVGGRGCGNRIGGGGADRAHRAQRAVCRRAGRVHPASGRRDGATVPHLAPGAQGCRHPHPCRDRWRRDHHRRGQDKVQRVTMTLNTWRNRPGRDLLITLAVLYVMLAAYAFYVSADVTGSLTAPFLVGMTLPMGLAHAVLTMNGLLTVAGLIIPVALLVVLIVRMPGYVRVPLLVGLVLLAVYVTVEMGIYVS